MKEVLIRGWLFQDERGHWRKLNYFEVNLYVVLETVQTITNPILDMSNMSHEYGMGRSRKRGGTTEAHNQGVPEEVIKMNNIDERPNEQWVEMQINSGLAS